MPNIVLLSYIFHLFRSKYIFLNFNSKNGTISSFFLNIQTQYMVNSYYNSNTSFEETVDYFCNFYIQLNYMNEVLPLLIKR